MSLRHALLAGSVSAMALIAGQAFAQDAQAPVSTVDEVVVTGIRASLQQSLTTKRNADAIIDVMDYLMKYVPDCLTGGDKYLEIFFRANTANTITSGAYEIQLNLISQGALTLPREG